MLRLINQEHNIGSYLSATQNAKEMKIWPGLANISTLIREQLSGEFNFEDRQEKEEKYFLHLLKMKKTLGISVITGNIYFIYMGRKLLKSIVYMKDGSVNIMIK